MTVEFTDRYGGNPPSWLTACHGDCEGMGVYPEWIGPTDAEGNPTMDYLDKPEWVAYGEAHQELTRRYEAGEITDEELHATHIPAPEEHWKFVKCPECHGRGRVGILRATSRVPRWLWKGLRFCAMCARERHTYKAPWVSWPNYLWITIKAAFLCDLKLARM